MKNKGFTLIELMIYVTIFVIVSSVFVLFILSLLKNQAQTRIAKEVSDSSQRAAEVMIYEIKHAQDVYISTSVLGTHPGQLSLETTRNAPVGETTTYVDFFIDNNDRLSIKREGSIGQPLTTEKVKIKNLVFDHITGNGEDSIRIQMVAVYDAPANKPFYQATTTIHTTANIREH